MSITINPGITTNASGSFNSSSLGYIQGMFMADPAIRNQLAGGLLAAAESLPMWGGVGISEFIPPLLAGGGASSIDIALGGQIKRATSLTAPTTGQSNNGALTGFSVFDQAHAMINTPQSPVPLSAGGMQVNFFRLGSGARIAVALDPVLADLEGYLINSLVSWDFALQRLVPYNAAWAANVITNASWSAGIVTLTTTSAHGVGVGVDVTISGFTPDEYNGTFTTTASTAGSTLKYALASDPGADTVQGQLDAGGGALPCKVLEVQVGNSMVVSFDPDTGFATWNRSGSTAIISI